MTPHIIGNLHELDLRQLHAEPAIYRLSHASQMFHASWTPMRRRRWSHVLRIGQTTDAGSRLGKYKFGRSKHARLDAFLREHHGQIEVELEFVHPNDLRWREAQLIIEHARKKRRIPRFNTRGEFRTACSLTGNCVTKDERTEYLLPWAEDALEW